MHRLSKESTHQRLDRLSTDDLIALLRKMKTATEAVKNAIYERLEDRRDEVKVLADLCGENEYAD